MTRLTPTGLLALALLLLTCFVIGVVAPTVDTAIAMQMAHEERTTK